MKILALSQPDVRPIKESGDLYSLNEVYKFGFEMDGREYWIVIPIGFKYDGATKANLLFQRDGIHRPAALIHDWFYENKGQLFSDGKFFEYDRKAADQLFLTALKYLGVKSWHCYVAYFVVRAVGGFYWRD